MQPPLVSSQPPNYSAFSQHLNALIAQKCQETGYSLLINHQLRLHFQKNPVLSDGTPLDLKRLNALPIDRSLALLPLVRRIRIAADLMGGIARVAQALYQDQYRSPLPLLTAQEIRQVEGLTNSVRELTDRVVTIYELDAFRVLRTFLFNSIGKCLQKDKILSARVNYPGLQNQTMKSILTHCRSLLLHTFAILGSLEDPRQFSEAAKHIAKVKEYLSSFSPLLEGKKRELQQVSKEIESIRLYLHLFEIALSKPLIYLPQMLVRVCVLPINASNELDKEWVSPFATDWINDSLTGWETQIESFFARTKDSADGAQLKELSEALLSEARNGINPEVSLCLKNIQEFANLSQLSFEQRQDKLNSLEKPIQELSQRIQQFHARYLQFKEWVDKLVADSKGTLHPVQAVVEADQPIYIYYRMVASIFETIETRYRFYRQFYQTIEKVIQPSSFKSLPHISLLDLLQLQMRALLPSDKMLFHAKFEGLLALIREEMAGYHASDDNIKIQAAFQAYQLQSELDSDATLKPYDEVIGILKHYFLMKDAQPLFSTNPFALNKQPPELEQQFFFELYASCRKILLSLQPESLLQLQAEGPHSTAVQKLINDFGNLSKIQDVLRTQDVTRANYQDLARDLIARMTQFTRGIEDRSEELQLLISLDLAKADSPALRKLSANLDHLNNSLQSLFFLPAQPLISHLHCEELTHEETVETAQKSRKLLRQARKPKPTQKKNILPVNVAERKPLEKPLVEPASSLWKSFFERNQELIQNLAKRELTEDQKACVQNLKGTLNLLQDLVTTVKSHGDRPYFILEANTAMMVHLEQTLALLKQAPGHDGSDQFVYQERGLEPNQHAPHLQIKQAIDPAHLAFMEKRQRVIAISSRYPGLEQDRLVENVKQTLSLTNPQLAEGYRKVAQADLNAGMNAFTALLKDQKLPPVFFDEEPISHEELDRILASKQGLEMDWKSTVDSCLHRFEATLARIQQYRMVSFHREVPSDELNGPQRRGTIRLALADLEMTARLCRDLLREGWDASQGLIVSKQAWLRQAVALERVLLLILSHLPASESENHFLWTENGSKLKRYSHELSTFTKKLRQFLKGNVSEELLNETQELAKDLEPYLKTLYRYHASPPCPAKARLNKIEGLMRLRKQLLGNLPGWKENQKDHLDKLLGATQPGERLSLLDAHILNIVRHDATLPLLDTLDLVEEWLQIYKNLLYKK